MKWIEWSDEQKAEWNRWLEECPAPIRAMCERWPMNHLYRLKTTGQRVFLRSYADDGTVTVEVSPEYNPERMMIIGRKVFGINPDDLEECDLPDGMKPIVGARKAD